MAFSPQISRFPFYEMSEKLIPVLIAFIVPLFEEKPLFLSQLRYKNDTWLTKILIESFRSLVPLLLKGDLDHK